MLTKFYLFFLRCYQAMRKSPEAYESCVKSGVIDDLSETFPVTSSGTQWAGVTDRIMGGRSSGTLAREQFEGRKANVLRAHVTCPDDMCSLEGNGGFVQMVTDMALEPKVSNTVDASDFDGLELEVFYDGKNGKESFNVQ